MSHRFIVETAGTLTSDPDDHELIAELIAGNSKCLQDAQNAMLAVGHRIDVISRRKLPSISLRISTTPEELRARGVSEDLADGDTAEARWVVQGQRGCCIDGYYEDFRNAVEHTLQPAHLEKQFNCSDKAIRAVQLRHRDRGNFVHSARPETPGSPLPSAVLDGLWRYGVAPDPSAWPGPWTAPGFPDHLTFACELARAYTQGGVDFTAERMGELRNKRIGAHDYANFMLQRMLGQPFNIWFQYGPPVLRPTEQFQP